MPTLGRTCHCLLRTRKKALGKIGHCFFIVISRANTDHLQTIHITDVDPISQLYEYMEKNPCHRWAVSIFLEKPQANVDVHVERTTWSNISQPTQRNRVKRSWQCTSVNIHWSTLLKCVTKHVNKVLHYMTNWVAGQQNPFDGLKCIQYMPTAVTDSYQENWCVIGWLSVNTVLSSVIQNIDQSDEFMSQTQWQQYIPPLRRTHWSFLILVHKVSTMALTDRLLILFVCRLFLFDLTDNVLAIDKSLKTHKRQPSHPKGTHTLPR